MSMPFFRRKRRSISTEAFKENINVLFEEYRPELTSNIKEFQALRNLECRKYIRKRMLILEIERGKFLSKLLKLWLFGLLGYILRFLKWDLSLDKLQEKDLERLYKDTRQNYAKKTLKQINQRLAREFSRAGYRYQKIELDTNPEEASESKQGTTLSPLTPESKIWSAVSKAASILRLPSLLAAIIGGIIIKFDIVLIKDWFAVLLCTSVVIHLGSGFANVMKNYSLWLQDIAGQMEEFCKAEKLSNEAIAEQWLTQLKKQAHYQIANPPKGKLWRKAVLAGGIVVLTLGYVGYMNWPGFQPEAQAISEDGLTGDELSGIDDTSGEEIIVEILDKETLLERIQNWGKITVLTHTGNNLGFERSIPKKIFGGTIPTTDLQIKVTYDYTVEFALDMQGLRAEDLEIDQGVVRIRVNKPIIDTITITNDRKEMSGAVFADNGTPEEELEAFEPGDETYEEILQKNVKALLLNDRSLQSKILLEAEKQIQNRLLDSDKLISGVEVVFKN